MTDDSSASASNGLSAILQSMRDGEQATNLAGAEEKAPPPAPAPRQRKRSNRKFFDHTAGLKDRLSAERAAIDRARLEISDAMLNATKARDDALAKANLDFEAIKTELEDKAEDAIEALTSIDAAISALS